MGCVKKVVIMKLISLALTLSLVYCVCGAPQTHMRSGAGGPTLHDAFTAFLQQQPQQPTSGNDRVDSFVRSSVDHLVNAVSNMTTATMQRIYGQSQGQQVATQLAFCMLDFQEQLGPFISDFLSDWYRHFITCGLADPSLRIGRMVGDLNDLIWALNTPCSDYVDPSVDLVVDVPRYFEPTIRNAINGGFQQLADAYNAGLVSQGRLADAATTQFMTMALNSLNVGLDPNYMYDVQNSFTTGLGTPSFGDLAQMFPGMQAAATQQLLNSLLAILRDLEFSFEMVSEQNQFNDEQMSGFFWGDPEDMVQTLETILEELQSGQAPTQQDATNLANTIMSALKTWRQYEYFNLDWNNYLGQYIPIICTMKAEAESELRVNLRQSIDPID